MGVSTKRRASVARGPGRPPKVETALARWLELNAARGVDRAAFAKAVGLERTYLDKLCRGVRRPSLEAALDIERATEKLAAPGVPASSWASVPAHKKD